MPGDAPAVTVIIPTYNSSATLRMALESALRQDYVDFEVWVAGDGCTDDSEAVASSFGDSRVHWLNLPANSGGPSAPRNEALRRAGGQFIAYLGHDDLWFPWHLSALVDCAIGSGSDLVFSLGLFIRGSSVHSPFTLTGRPWRRPRGPGISPTNWLHCRTLIDRVGNWNTAIRDKHDREFAQRVLDCGACLQYCPRLTALKYPAHTWRRHFALTSELPQSRHLDAMRSDAAALRDQLLLETAKRFSDVLEQPPDPLHRPLVDWFWRGSGRYGRDRWPVSALLRWYRRRSGRIGGNTAG